VVNELREFLSNYDADDLGEVLYLVGLLTGFGVMEDYLGPNIVFRQRQKKYLGETRELIRYFRKRLRKLGFEYSSGMYFQHRIDPYPTNDHDELKHVPSGKKIHPMAIVLMLKEFEWTSEAHIRFSQELEDIKEAILDGTFEKDDLMN